MLKALRMPVFSAAVFAASAVSAGSPPESAFVTNDLAVAKEALGDGLWQIARDRAAKDGSDEALLVVLESYASEGDWENVAKTLGTRGGKDDAAAFRYYRAAVEGDRAKAAEVLASSGSYAGAVAAKMIEAGLLVKNGDMAGAEKLWREVALSTNAGERAYATAAVNLGDSAILKEAYSSLKTPALKRLAAVRLATVLVKSPGTFAEGMPLVLRIAKDAPDAPGAREAFIALAQAELKAGKWGDAEKRFRDAVEIWPDAAKIPGVAEGRGWAELNLGKTENALESFKLAEAVADTDERKAVAVLKQGDILSDCGRGEEALAEYREVLARYPETEVARKLKRIVAIRELESRGRDLYGEYRFSEAKALFEKVASEDPALKPRMDFYSALCLYGQGNDGEAEKVAREIVASGKDDAVRLEVKLWLAKLLYNNGSWKESGRFFRQYADSAPQDKSAPEALMWASRAAFADNDMPLAIQTATLLASRYKADSAAKTRALLVQSEALVESARFDEAVLILENVVSSPSVTPEDRLKAGILKADALFAMGSDNPARYGAALEAYQAILFGEALPDDGRIILSFKIARTLDKLKRTADAIARYYESVVLAYCEGRMAGTVYGDEVRAVFTRAAFRIADHYESLGKDAQALNVLERVAKSDVPAAGEALKRMSAIREKGKIL